MREWARQRRAYPRSAGALQNAGQPSYVKKASENRIANLIVGVDLMKNRRDSLVTKKIVASSLTLASFILTLAFALGSGSFAHPTAANAMAAADALSYLPATDAIALIDVRPPL